MSGRALPSLAVAMVWMLGSPAAAQDYAPSATTHQTPAHIALVDGAVVLERDGQIDRDPRSMPLLTGDRLRTESGRAEVLFADGSALHLDAGTIIDFQSDEVVRLLQGRIRLAIVGPGRDVFYRIDAPSGWVELHEIGEYRVAVPAGGEVELAVLRGSAELVNELGRTPVRAGERTFARAGAAPSPPYVFNSAAWDAFDHWSEGRRAERMGTSAQYLPSDIRPYSRTFDMYGTWRHVPAHGYVWYPRVAPGWRPFFHGRWVSLRPYGWTWVAADPWGWPTHHFGRWGFSAGVWFWIPGRHWGPAWVSWAYTPHYVSWAPLGWDNRPLVQIVNINIGVGRRFSPWDVWTVVPRHHFSGTFVNVRAIGPVRIDHRVHNTFVIRDRAPETRFAVARDASPIRTAGRFAVPRSDVAASSSIETGRRITSPGAPPTAERRFPAPARTPGQRVADGATPPPAGTRAVARDPGPDTERRAGSRSPSAPHTPAPGGSSRAVAREAEPDTSPVPSWRTRSTAAPAAPTGSRAVSRQPESGTAATPSGRSRTSDRTSDAPARTTPEAGSRRAAPADAPARSTETAPPTGAVRAVPRPRTSSAGEAAPDRPDSSTRVVSPSMRRPTAAAAQPAASEAPARSRTWSPGPVDPSNTPTRRPPAAAPRQTGAVASPPAAPRRQDAAPPPSRTVRQAPAPERRTGEATGWGRAAPRSQPAPSSAPPRVQPERRAPAQERAVSPPSAPSRSAQPSSRSGESRAGSAGGRQRSDGSASSGDRARRRE